MMEDKRVLILGPSTISMKAYETLANEVNTDVILGQDDTTFSPASNPNHTKVFCESIKGEEDEDLKIYQRAIKCVDDAVYIIVDLSSASTGMGLEVGYLLTTHPDKIISFIAKKGSKISPHIKGLYKKATGEDLKVEFYEDEKDMADAVKRSLGYEEYYLDMIH